MTDNSSQGVVSKLVELAQDIRTAINSRNYGDAFDECGRLIKDMEALEGDAFLDRVEKAEAEVARLRAAMSQIAKQLREDDAERIEPDALAYASALDLALYPRKPTTARDLGD